MKHEETRQALHTNRLPSEESSKHRFPVTTVQQKLHSKEEHCKKLLPVPHRPIETRHTVLPV
jgi:hypothetical protein